MPYILSVYTLSGSIYDFRVPEPGKKQVMRRNANEPMRRDGEWLNVSKIFYEMPNVGDVMLMELEPLGDGDLTTRITSPITEIKLEKVEYEED